MKKEYSFTYVLIIGIALLSMLSPIKIMAFSHDKPITIRFASEVYPPFTYIHSSKELHGFDIDIAKALCEKISAKCTFSHDKFSNMAASLNSHKYDAWINALTIDEEYQKDVRFSNPYFATQAMLIATNNTVFNAAPVEIKDRTIGATEHTCYILYLNNTYGNTIKIKIFHTANEAFSALEKGEIDAVIDNDLVLKHWRFSQKKPSKYRLIGLPAKYSKLVWHQYGIAVAKDNMKLLEDVNRAIDQIKSDGTHNRLIKKHFSSRGALLCYAPKDPD